MQAQPYYGQGFSWQVETALMGMHVSLYTCVGGNGCRSAAAIAERSSTYCSKLSRGVEH